jgi:hypothetical protein
VSWSGGVYDEVTTSAFQLLVYKVSVSILLDDFQSDWGYIVPCFVLCNHGHSGTVGEYEPPIVIVASLDKGDAVLV